MSIVKCCFDSQVEVPEFLDSVLQKCTTPGCCFSCTCMRPRYKRLVDNIFPQNPQDGLVKNNMEKLTFYSLSSPEKLDRIGEYLFQRASRDISRKKTGFVVIAMEAMDQLLVACHAQALNLFVESFLRMVQKLLESTEPDLQVLATQSFVKFANIEEDTPSYHRRYDFFVSKFSSMCHANNPDEVTRNMIRMAGIKGLQGVIRKTVSDDLVENIWEAVHMDKIVPSLLYNMQDSKLYKRSSKSVEDTGGPESPDIETNSDPASLADTCIRELVSRASFGHVRSVLLPVLRHLDYHKLWVPNNFAVHVFRIIMFSIQTQYSYTVVESLMSHLDNNANASAKIKTSITHVLSKIISISAEESVGPSVLEIINSLLGHLRVSVTRADPEESEYRDALIHCLGEFTAHLPDYQKVEIMVFIISKVPNTGEEKVDTLLQQMLLKSLLTVGRRYKTVAMTTTFPVTLLDPLLRLCLTGGNDLCILVQRIFHTLLDRHNNAPLLQKPTLDVSGLSIEECSRGDTMFLRKYGDEIYSCLLERCANPATSPQVVDAIYTTLALIAVELLTSNTISNYLFMVYSLQELAKTSDLPVVQKNKLHSVAISLLILSSSLSNIDGLNSYADNLVTERRGAGGILLPGREMITSPTPSLKHLIDQKTLEDALRDAGLETATISRNLTHRHSWVDTTGVTMKGSMTDLNSLDVESTSSTPGLQRKYPEEELSFEAMKRVLAESSEAVKAKEKDRQEQLLKAFQTSTFQEIMSNHTVKDEDTLHSKVMDLLNKASQVTHPPLQQPPLYEVLFPELFAY